VKKLAHRAALLGASMLTTLTLFGQTANKVDRPWMNTKLSPGQRADLVLEQLTLDEKISLLHGEGMARQKHLPPEIQAVQDQSNGGAGFVLGVPRLGIPRIQMSDAAYGVRQSAENGRYSTALPSNVGSAASWDPDAACAYGKLIGDELRMQGYNATLGGGVDITRDPRNGRTFEYMGEDPVLAGTRPQPLRRRRARHLRRQALRVQRSGERPPGGGRGDRRARRTRKRSARL